MINRILLVRMIHNGYFYEGSIQSNKMVWYNNTVSGQTLVSEDKHKELTEKFKQLAKDV